MASALISALSVLLCALALILYSSPAEAQADLALDCCLTVSHKVIPKHVLLTYRKQFRVDGCPRDAVVFITRKDLNLCAPPAAEEHWVKETIKFLDTRLKKCKATKFHVCNSPQIHHSFTVLFPQTSSVVSDDIKLVAQQLVIVIAQALQQVTFSFLVFI
ncbi:C-C motif chemokine 3-like 1 [Sinocyclocheilus rhinocerous]|uniref:C-C motif chemokine n=1 Tax=Sinocyclocheilus rhinocerous TaxID=307959 RepID=A0A673JYX1_9TELE|nr:PREDICTED: C-C motif chemokine 3-like 1 [Sinocyclocheilus rhinocerous]